MEGWRQARFIAYMIAQARFIDSQMTIWDFMPLEGDPTPEEVIELKKQEHNKRMDQAKIAHDQWKKKKYGENVKLN